MNIRFLRNSTGQAKMTTINLYQNQPKKQKNLSASSGFIFSISILVIVILVLVGLKFYVSFMEKQNQALKEEIEKEQTNMANLGSLEKVIDVQSRLKQIRSNLNIKNNQVSRLQMTKVLDNVGAEINSGVVISSYKYEDGKNKITMVFDAKNFSDAARQILNFKDSNYFTSVVLTSISRGTEKISFSVELSVKS